MGVKRLCVCKETLNNVPLYCSQSPNPKWQKRYNMLYQQLGLVGQIRSIMSDVLSVKEDRIKKVRCM